VSTLEQFITAIDRSIALYMFDNKLTREQMAAQLDMSANTLRWKREGKNEWLLSEVMKLSELTHKSLDELTGFNTVVSV
jgi:hypothetical protein